ncbi:D-alanyl-D-alanine carboxypeptidase [Streptomyces sp. NPDC002788]
MAGESPDRSKQRESSAEPTSGSAGPVPEARSESADPRLAVARDAKSSSTAARGGVDTATRVLSVRTAEEPEDAERDAERDTQRNTDAAADAERGDSDSGTEDAVADAEGVSAGAGRGASDSGEVPEARRADAERDEDAPGAEEAVADAEQGEEPSGAADPEQGESASVAAGEGGQEPAEASVKGSGKSPGSGGQGDDAAAGDGRLRDAVAAWVVSADEDVKPADAEGRAEAAEGADKASADGRQTDGKASEPAQGGTAAVDGQEAGDSDRPSGTGDRAEEGREAKGPDKPADTGKRTGDNQEAKAANKPADTGEGAQDGQAAAGSAGGPEGGQEGVGAASKGARSRDEEAEADRSATAGLPGTDGEIDTAASETDTDTEGETDTAASDAGGPARDASRTADTGGEAAEPADPRSEDAEADSKARAGTTAAAEDNAAESETEDETEDENTGDAGKDDDGGKPSSPPVDQPTAVFKAVRPPVDQPTTMLKLGGAPKATAKATSQVAPKDAPEKESERTSKFVALKPLDDPATRKPPSDPQAGPAAPAGRTRPADATAPVPTVGPERTTQQPLPPKPPLDLLAELTNTPPPPATPLRTAVRRVKIWTPLALLLVIVFAVVQSVRPLPTPTLDLTAKDSYTFEGGKVDIPWPTDGQAALDVQGIGTFGSSGEQKPVPIASVAKVMTAYLILRDHPLKSGEKGPKIDIDQAAQDQSDAGQESTVDVTKGDQITEREALESILIASANNVARLLARWDAGSEKAFVQKMNDAAKDLGMKNTTYTDPSGLNNTTVSTAVDQVKLAKAAMQQPAFREVAAMMSYVDYKGTKHDNWNRLVGYNDVTGIKTGTTTSALGNLVFSARKDVDGETRRIVGAVVRQPAGGPDNTILGAALHEGDKLIRAAQGALESATILKKGDIVGYADDGLGGRTPVVATEDVTAVGWAGLSVKLTFAADDLPHQAKAGRKVGTLTVGDGTTSAVKVPVALQKDLVEPGFADKLTRIG